MVTRDPGKPAYLLESALLHSRVSPTGLQWRKSHVGTPQTTGVRAEVAEETRVCWALTCMRWAAHLPRFLHQTRSQSSMRTPVVAAAASHRAHF